ncbi:SDR family oxidoreductase [Spirosoma sp. KUDC1026]|uniref:SDR family oxidoreductase n=1 Tax=Spirosoma sp. KUDC1026 TaxID=2745947 RepID=UPI00159BB083|nr:SDR family oxidoreductase [Spirosoma sp. KUDC1026]QKZ13204.1 SDR family oxidoreductase [Spirosoma sp. KUDC1026]
MTQLQDPRHQYPAPPYPQEDQDHPGSDAKMTPTADHGETSYKGSGRLAGRKALITGGDSGIGRAVAIAFAKEGADVMISYLSEQKDANETVRQVEAAGQKAVAVMGDIQDEAHCKELVQQAVDEFGQLDILVNNAAFQMNHDSFLELPSDEFEKTYRTNVFAMFYLCKAAVPVMKPGSSIINTASIQAYMPEPSILAYAGTKAAIVNFSKALAKEAIEHGIRVNAVAPGPVWTPLIPATMPEDKVKTFGEDSLLGRAAQPVELSPIYVLLASQEASYITGMVYGATGGRPIG